jgi:DsbC/DsbD-like thiol-disulfide interchange protein
LAGLLVATATAFASAQARAPKADVAATPAALSAAAGTTVKATLTIKLPEDIHVQSDKPRDPLLIATALTLTPPNGIAVDHIVYPKPTDLAQPGRKEPLAVFSGTFTIDAFLRVGADTAAGDMTLPAQLRYQACNDTVCFVPARADVQWTLHVAPR